MEDTIASTVAAEVGKGSDNDDNEGNGVGAMTTGAMVMRVMMETSPREEGDDGPPSVARAHNN